MSTVGAVVSPPSSSPPAAAAGGSVSHVGATLSPSTSDHSLSSRHASNSGNAAHHHPHSAMPNSISVPHHLSASHHPNQRSSILSNSTSFTSLSSINPSLSPTTSTSSLYHVGGSSTGSSSALLVNKPSLVEFGFYRFLIMDTPTDNNVCHYVEICKKKHVVTVVRACEPTYASSAFINAGINVLDVSFDDGSPPPDSTVNQVLNLVHTVYGEREKGEKEDKSKKKNNHTASSSSTGHKKSNSKEEEEEGDDAAGGGSSERSSSKRAIAVHCVAGLGRAPVLVCITLIELGMSCMDAITLVRKKRRGALNARQLSFVQNYKPKKKSDCTIS